MSIATEQMKIIEGLKKEKELLRKFDDLKKKIGLHSAHLNTESPVYADQKKQVSEWIQSCKDILKDLQILRMRIYKTNIATKVSIEFKKGDKPFTVERSIAEWIHRRMQLAEMEKSIYGKLTDKNLKEGTVQDSNGQKVDVKIVRCYEPIERDKSLDLYSNEPITIDSKLEVVNATTNLLEY